MTPFRSASAIPCRCPPSMAKAWANSMTRCARRCPKRPPSLRGRGPGVEGNLRNDEEDGSELDVTKPLRIAVVGRPNAGKSTLINRMLGEDRLLTGPEAGITRDSIARRISLARPQDEAVRHGRSAQARPRRRQAGKALRRRCAARRALFGSRRAACRFDDSLREAGSLSIADLAAREGRAVVIALGKWDLIDDRGATLAKLREEAERLLPQLSGCPVVPVSGATG